MLAAQTDKILFEPRREDWHDTPLHQISKLSNVPPHFIFEGLISFVQRPNPWKENYFELRILKSFTGHGKKIENRWVNSQTFSAEEQMEKEELSKRVLHSNSTSFLAQTKHRFCALCGRRQGRFESRRNVRRVDWRNASCVDGLHWGSLLCFYLAGWSG